MSAAQHLTWEQYQKLPLDKRRRPLTPAEYASLTRQQRVQAGLDEDEQGAPTDFSGPVLPNPDRVQPQWDTEPAVPVTRLPHGVTFQRGNYQGGAQGDISNPPATEALMPAMRTVGSDMSEPQKSSPQTVPMIFEGDQAGARDVPFDKIREARQNGGKLGVYMKFKDDPTGQKRVVPADKMAEAAQHGGEVLPFSEQPTDHPGFWHAALTDALGAAKGLVTMAAAGMGNPVAQSEVQQGLIQQAMDAPEQWEQRKKEGHGLAYRVAAPVVGMVANVPGMEEAAREGDVAGVAGHMAAGQAMAAAPLAIEGAVRGAEALPVEATRPVRLTARAINKVLSKAPGSVGAATGAAVGHATGIPGAAEIGGAAGYALGKEVLPQVRVPGEGFGLPSRVTGGPEVAPQFTEPSAAGSMVRSVEQPKVSPQSLQNQIEQGLGGRPLKPNVPLREQMSVPGAKEVQTTSRTSRGTAAGGASELSQPQPRTPAPAGESSAVESFRYDPEAKEMHVEGKNGRTYVYGEVTPEQAQMFHEAESKGMAWKSIKDNNTLVAKVIDGKRINVRPRTVVTDPDTGKPEFSDVVVKQGEPNLNDPEVLQDLLNKSLKTLKTPVSGGSQAADLGAVKPVPGGVMTTADPEMLSNRWGVTKETLARGREQTRGWTGEQTETELNKMADLYRKGHPVEPVIETRDAGNNIVQVDGRGRVLAAQRAGVKRIPVIVRRLGASAPQ